MFTETSTQSHLFHTFSPNIHMFTKIYTLATFCQYMLTKGNETCRAT